MYTADEAIEALLQMGHFRAREFAGLMGFTRQAALVHVRKRLLTGELVVKGYGRETRYVRGPGRRVDEGGQVRGLGGLVDGADDFWKGLAESARGICYLRVASALHPNPRLKREACALLEGLDLIRYLVVDLEGVQDMSEAFANELFARGAWERSLSAQPINATPKVSRVIDRMRRLWALKPAAKSWD